jgi:hypothetical protein
VHSGTNTLPRSLRRAGRSWLTELQSLGLAPDARAVAGDEVAEFLLYLIRQSDKSAIDDLLENAHKYTEL